MAASNGQLPYLPSRLLLLIAQLAIGIVVLLNMQAVGHRWQPFRKGRRRGTQSPANEAPIVRGAVSGGGLTGGGVPWDWRREWGSSSNCCRTLVWCPCSARRACWCWPWLCCSRRVTARSPGDPGPVPAGPRTHLVCVAAVLVVLLLIAAV